MSCLKVKRTIYRATAYAERAICYRPNVRPSFPLFVCLSVCLSHRWIRQKRL